MARPPPTSLAPQLPSRILIGKHSFVHPRRYCDAIFEGTANDYRDFPRTRQAKTIRELQETLAPLGAELSGMIAGLRTDCLPRRPLVAFAWSSDGKFIWQKYEGKSPGSGSNKVFVGNVEMNTTAWMSMSYMDRQNLFFS